MSNNSTLPNCDTVNQWMRWQRWLGVPRQSGQSSASDVELVATRPLTFAGETAVLLRVRLAAYSLVSFATLCFFVLQSLLMDRLLLGFRVAVVIVIGTCYATVRWKRGPTERRLEALKFIVLISMVAYAAVMMTARIIDYADRHDPISLTAVQQGYMGGWAFLILTYGLFIPMSWRSAALLLLPVGVLPAVVLSGLSWLRSDVAGVFGRDQVIGFSTLPPVAAAVAVYAAHSIYRIREAAYQGRRFGQYVLGERIGSGGMGEVFRAEHLLLKRPCAIKLIRPDQTLDERTIQRFETEVRAAAALSHPNTIEIYDFGRTKDATLYYVMELLRGLNLDDLVSRFGPLSPERVVYLLRQLCGALGEAHSAGLVHRDIKPSNIFAAERGGVYDFVKLLDFGLVRQGANNIEPDEGSFGGSPQYMAPEQFSCFETVGARSDIYSLGAVAYFLLIGRPPFAGRWIKELRDAHAHQVVVRPSLMRPSLGADLDELLLRCLAKSPDDRFPSAAALQVALDACISADGWSPERAREWWLEHPLGAAHQPRETADTVS